MPKRLASHEPERISVDVPPEVVELLGPDPSEAAACLKRLALIDLYRRGEVSGGYAADVLRITLWDFVKLLSEHDVPYFEATEDELRQQVEASRKLSRSHRSPSSPTPAP